MFSTGSTNHSRTELHNIPNSEWVEATSFNSSYLWYFDYASFFYENEFYVVGGRISINGKDELSSMVAKFNPNSENWSEVGELNFARRGHQATVIEWTVFVVGGGSKGIKSEVCQLSDTFNCTIIDQKFSDAESPTLYEHDPQQCKPGFSLLYSSIYTLIFRKFCYSGIRRQYPCY